MNMWNCELPIGTIYSAFKSQILAENWIRLLKVGQNYWILINLVKVFYVNENNVCIKNFEFVLFSIIWVYCVEASFNQNSIQYSIGRFSSTGTNNSHLLLIKVILYSKDSHIVWYTIISSIGTFIFALWFIYQFVLVSFWTYVLLKCTLCMVIMLSFTLRDASNFSCIIVVLLKSVTIILRL